MRWVPRTIVAMCFVASGDSLDPVAFPCMVFGALFYGFLVWAAFRARERPHKGSHRGKRR
jgi:hypothetical protein